MKVYAILLGLVLTLGSGYAADVAVSSVGAGTGVTGVPTRALNRGPDTIWYGGVLDPITVEAPGNGPAQPAARRMLLNPPAAPCAQRSQISHAVI
jgi:hypothetical protein